MIITTSKMTFNKYMACMPIWDNEVWWLNEYISQLISLPISNDKDETSRFNMVTGWVL